MLYIRLWNKLNETLEKLIKKRCDNVCPKLGQKIHWLSLKMMVLTSSSCLPYSFITCFHVAHVVMAAHSTASPASCLNFSPCGLYQEPNLTKKHKSGSPCCIKDSDFLRSNMYIYCTALTEDLACANLLYFSSSGRDINEVKIVLGHSKFIFHEVQGNPYLKTRVEEWS